MIFQAPGIGWLRDTYVLTKVSDDNYTSTLNGVASDTYSGSGAYLTNDTTYRRL